MRLKNKTGLKVIQIKKEKVELSLSADGIILFAVIIFDCTESLLLRGVSPVAAHGHLIAEASHSTGLSLRGLLIAGASHCGGFSCGAQALGTWASVAAAHIFQKIHPTGQQAHRKMFNITDYQGNANKTTMRYYFTPVTMAVIKKTRDNRCW